MPLSLVRAAWLGGTRYPNKSNKHATRIPAGCGRGYDVAEMVRLGAAESIGLDLAPTAKAEADEYIRTEAGLSPAEQAKAKVVLADFFQFTDPGFDIAYDYTFFCALRPDMRNAWAEKYATLIRPGGKLITMMYPCDPNKDRSVGPPFPVFPEDYDKALLANGFRKEHVVKLGDDISVERRKGLEYLGIWTRI